MKDKNWIPIIAILSVVVPALVAALLYVPREKVDPGVDVSFIPAINAGINFTVSIFLILGFVFIRQKKIQFHRYSMLVAFGLSAVFLILYVIYHYIGGHVKYNGEGAIKTFYLFILASHIILSVAIVPLALLSIYRALKGEYEKHRKIVKFAWPIWLYVAITGVIVYLMAHPFNPVV